MPQRLHNQIVCDVVVQADDRERAAENRPRVVAARSHFVPGRAKPCSDKQNRLSSSLRSTVIFDVFGRFAESGAPSVRINVDRPRVNTDAARVKRKRIHRIASRLLAPRLRHGGYISARSAAIEVQSWSAFGNRRSTGSWRVGSRYLTAHRKIGLRIGAVWRTYKSSGTSSHPKCSFGS